MPPAPGSIVRALPSKQRTLRPLAMMVLAAPLALGACVAENNMKSAALARKGEPAKPTGGPDAYGYAPVKLAALGDGMHVALPSAKPDWEKLQAAAASQAVRPAVATAAKPAQVTRMVEPPLDEIAALKADVEERKASLTILADGKTDRVAQPAAAAPEVPVQAASAAKIAAPAAEPAAEIASAKDLIDPRKSVPAAISAVAHSADAVKVAAIDTTAMAIGTTSRAINAVQERIGDTFKGTDTVTGSASIDQMIEQAAAENNIPTELAYAVVRVESHYNPTAIGGGAYGLSQIKPATARGLGFDGPAKGLFDPRTNLRYGMKYLSGAWELSGHDVCGTAMRYKGGHRTTTMSKAAAIYCSNVKRHMAAIERRRAPANRETIVAANERTKQIATAGKPFDMRARAKILAASVPATGQAPAGAFAAAPSVSAAAASQAGRAVAASAVPVPTSKAAAVAVPAGTGVAKSGRVRVYADGDAAGPTASTIAANGRFGYAE